MRKRLLTIFIIFCCFGCASKADTKNELISFFNNKNFVTEEHNMGGEKLLFSYIPSDKTNNCFFKGILYKENKNEYSRSYL